MTNKIYQLEAISPEQIEAWKKEHEDVYEVTAPYKSEKVKAYFRGISMADLILIGDKLSGAERMKGMNTLYNSCILGGHPAFQKNTSVIMVGIRQLSSVIEAEGGEIKNL